MSPNTRGYYKDCHQSTHNTPSGWTRDNAAYNITCASSPTPE
jgi:hypothetical protein